jgi:hypothetical protein
MNKPIASIRPFRLLALLPAVLAACSSGPSAPRAVLDENTGVTINAVSAPLLFVRIHGDANSGARDYVTLVAAENDNAGKYTDLFLMYRWSISFHGMAPQPPQNAGRIVLEADGREIVLQPMPEIPVDLSRHEDLFVPEGDRVEKYAYLTNFDTMRAIAESHTLTLRLPQEPEAPDTPFALWRDGRPALNQLVNQLNGS